MAKRKKSRIYWRDRGGENRAYGDFRDYADVGGKQEALIPPGASRGTTDPDVAAKLAAYRLAELEQRRRRKNLTGFGKVAGLAGFAQHHLVQKARTGAASEQWLTAIEKHLSVAVSYFGADRDVAAISPTEVQAYVNWLLRQSNGRGGTLAPGTARQYLNSLSNLFRRAIAEEYVPVGYNPVGAILEKPQPNPSEARWLEVHDAARLLETARLWRRDRIDGLPPDLVHAVLATFLLTGGRKSEVLGLEVKDLSFDRRRLHFRPNQWRRLKTRNSHRSVPLWPQLEQILQSYVFGGESPLQGLLFPSPVRANGDRMIRDLRKSLDAIGRNAGWEKGEIRSRMFRHTYCAARLQTLDQGAPVSQFTVARELGHGGTQLVQRIYGHLGAVRHRAEVVEYPAVGHRGANPHHPAVNNGRSLH